MPEVLCQYDSLAARHVNSINNDYILTVNTDHGVDICKRNGGKKKTLDIEYMRCSLVVGNLLLIGTEEKLVHLVDTKDLNVKDRTSTQSFVFSLILADHRTLLCG